MNAGFSDKSAPSAPVDPALEAAIRQRSTQGRIPCARAFAIAKALSIPPDRVGAALDALDCKIIQCQLGLFGYQNAEPLPLADALPDRIKTALEKEAPDGEIACDRAWALARHLGVDRLSLGRACDGLEIHIHTCQLGAF